MSLSKLWDLVMDREAWRAAVSPWGCKKSDMTEWLNWTEKEPSFLILIQTHPVSNPPSVLPPGCSTPPSRPQTFCIFSPIVSLPLIVSHILLFLGSVLSLILIFYFSLLATFLASPPTLLKNSSTFPFFLVPVSHQPASSPYLYLSELLVYCSLFLTGFTVFKLGQFSQCHPQKFNGNLFSFFLNFSLTLSVLRLILSVMPSGKFSFW